MAYSRIIGVGSYLPDKVLLNHDLDKKLETSDAWIQQRTGIKQRHLISGQESVTSMGAAAAQKALTAANISASEIDMVIGATLSGDKVFPAMACLIQAELGIDNCCPAFDVQSACSGFIYALTVADKMLRSGEYKNILVIGSEAMSRVLDWSDRTTCVLFGDGAGAAVLQASETPGILKTFISSDGNAKDLLYLNSALADEDPYLRMQGNAVFKFAVKKLSEMVVQAQLNNIEIDWLVPHQANNRIIQALAKSLQLPMQKVIVTVDKHANTSAASIPLALDDAINTNKVKPGQVLLLESFGGGLSWGSVLVKL